MGSLGFGLERIGIIVLRTPLLSTIAVLAVFAIAASTIPNLRFQGQVIEVIDQSSVSYENFENHVIDFRDTSNDVALILRHKDLMKANELEVVRDLHLELALTGGIDHVTSMFSLGDFSAKDGGFEPFLADILVDDEQASEAMSQLMRDTPAAHLLVAPEKNAALLIASLETDAEISEAELRSRLTALEDTVAAIIPAGTETMIAGLPAIRAALVDAIISDQRRLVIIGIAVGAIFSFLVFGSIRSAVICTFPGILAVVWLLALFSISGTKLDFITTVLPTLTLIIAFADSVVLFFKWQMLNGENDDQLENLRQAILRVGPASALTSITTALAFLSFTSTGSDAMQNFSLFGVGAVTIAFLAVITGLPLACYWSIRLGSKKGQRQRAFLSLGGLLSKPAGARPRLAVGVSAILLTLLTWSHMQLEPSYKLTNSLPYGSDVRTALDFMDRNFGGTMRFFVLVPVAPGSTFADPENRKRITDIDDALSGVPDVRHVQSLGGIWRSAEPGKIDQIARTINDAEPAVRTRHLSMDGQTMQVAVTISGESDTLADAATVAEMRATLEQLGPANDVVITGMRVLVAEEFPKLITQLRQGLLIAVFLAVGVVILATRSWRMGLAALVPNLLPILVAEAIILITGNRLDITNVIALTIAFGISIDNAVHIINGISAERKTGESADQAILNGIREVAPALAAGTAILCVATVITQFSPLPSVVTLGRLLIITLVMALVSNLLFLPAYIRLLGRIERNRKTA